MSPKERYVEELATYIRWTNRKKASYRTDDVMRWGNTDYREIHGWNDSFEMAKRILGLTDEEDKKLFKKAEIKAQEPGKDTPWNYWKESEVA